MLSSIINLVISVMENMGYLGLFVLMVLESMALPIPSEVVLPFSGYLVYLGKLNIVLAIIDATVASIVGSLITYAISYYVGYDVVLKLGGYVRINEKHLKIAEAWFNRYGGLSILISKFVPEVRALISVPAGVVHMNTWLFILYTTLGSMTWNTVLVYLGLILGPSWEYALTLVTNYSDYLAIAFAVVITTLVIVAKFKPLPWVLKRK